MNYYCQADKKKTTFTFDMPTRNSSNKSKVLDSLRWIHVSGVIIQNHNILVMK